MERRRDALSQSNIDVAGCTERVELKRSEVQVTKARAESPCRQPLDAVLVTWVGCVVERPLSVSYSVRLSWSWSGLGFGPLGARKS